jgi:predicted AAA+ superfamily ATPase
MMEIQRPEYLKRLIGFKDKDLIKVIVGIRRCGKSTLLKLYADYLRSTGVENSRIQFINFEDFNNAELTDYKVLHEHVLSCLAPGGMNYIFLDEIQLVKDFEKAANSLRLRTCKDFSVNGNHRGTLSSP